MANENILSGLRCPSCGGYEPLTITFTTTGVFYDSGLEKLIGDNEWDDSSRVLCDGCSRVGTIESFADEDPGDEHRHKDSEDCISCSICGHCHESTDLVGEFQDEGWYFTMLSDVFGEEDFGPYDSKEEAEAAIKSVQEEAARLGNALRRFYSAPFEKEEVRNGG